ncbi:hypothetical protein BU15DRAFT_56917 [Melanogaster broomeanus]|nr:hypothetical protein BU15DRAFT_56917 [Melanogaster broomeanus]
MELIDSPWHQDPSRCPHSYDCFLSLGTSHDASLNISDFGASLKYTPGSVVYLTGRVLRHSVKQCQGGERAVLVHFAKDAVHNRMLCPSSSVTYH